MDSKINNSQDLEQQFDELLSMINYHRSLASQAVNKQQLLTAWNVGAYVSKKLKTEQWGSKVVTQFSEYMKTKAPEIKGFSRRNIYNMVMFYDEYSAPKFFTTVHSYIPNLFVQSPTAQIQHTNKEPKSGVMGIVQFTDTQSANRIIEQIPDILLYTSFTNHIAILNQCGTTEERLFCMIYAHRERLKVKELQRCISNDTYTSLLGSKHNLSKGLLQTYPDAPVLFKDKAFIDFLGLPQKHSEKKLRMGLVDHMKQFCIPPNRSFL